MTERFISDDFWDDPMIEDCDTDGKCLYIYLFSNKHQKAHGIMKATIKKISQETGITQERIKELINYYGTDKVVWIEEKSLIWVKNFIIRQSKNASFLQSAVNNLFLDIKDSALIREYIDFYSTLGLWCKYGVDTVFTPYNTVLSCNNISNNTVLSKSSFSSLPSFSSKEEPVMSEEELVTPDRKAEGIWQEVLTNLKKNVSPANYDTWLKDTVGMACRNSDFLVAVPSNFTTESINKRLLPLIEKALADVAGKNLKVHFKVAVQT